MKHIVFIALLLTFASCKKDESAQKVSQVNNKFLGSYDCYATGGFTTGTSHGTLDLSYSGSTYYLQNHGIGLNFWGVLDSVPLTFSGNNFTINAYTEDSISALDLTAYDIMNGTGTINDSVMTLHYTVEEVTQSGTEHKMYTYDLTGTK